MRYAIVTSVTIMHGMVSGSILMSTIAAMTIITSILFMIMRILPDLWSGRSVVMRHLSKCVDGVVFVGRGGVSSADVMSVECCRAVCTAGRLGGRQLLGVTCDSGL